MSIMDVGVVKGYFEAVMRRLGFAFAWENDFAVLTAGIGGRRWKMALKCMEDRFILYASYPQQVPGGRRAGVLDYLNTLNAASGFGSYFLLEAEQGYLIVCRGDVLIPDEYSIFECIECGFKFMSAEIYSKWGQLHDQLRVIDT